MRAIRFRAWDVRQKRMLSPAMPTIGGAITFGVDAQGYDVLGEHYVLMQFTGLLDKHGKKIYEGDVLVGMYGEQSSPDDTLARVVGEVKEWKGGFIVDFPMMHRHLHDLNGNHAFYWRLIGSNKDWFCRIEDVAILGNIYEHPALLQEATRHE